MLHRAKGIQKNIIIGSIYRPPNKGGSDFISVFGTLMKQLNKEKWKDIILGLDHNMDFLKHHTHSRTQDFLEMITDSGLLPTQMRPTRITPNSATLIDNILLLHNLMCSKNSSVIVSDISDHMPCLTIIKQCRIKKDQKN